MFGFFKKSPQNYPLNPHGFAAAASAVVAIWYTIFALVLASHSEFVASWWAKTHYLKNAQDLTDFTSHFEVTIMGYLLGLIFHIVFIYAIAYGFAILYNRMQK